MTPKITMELTTSVADIKAVMTHPDIYTNIAEDGAPTPDEYTPPFLNEKYLLGRCDGAPFALVIYDCKSVNTWGTHVQVLPEYRQYAERFSRAAQDWAFEHGAKKLVAEIPFTHPNVMQFGLKLGWKIEGVNERSIMKHGKMVDQWYLGLAR